MFSTESQDHINIQYNNIPQTSRQNNKNTDYINIKGYLAVFYFSSFLVVSVKIIHD